MPVKMTGSDLVGSKKSWDPVEGSCLGALVLMHCAGRLTRLLSGREQCLGASIFFLLETISVSFLLMIPPCSFGWLLLSQCSFPWYSLADLSSISSSSVLTGNAVY